MKTKETVFSCEYNHQRHELQKRKRRKIVCKNMKHSKYWSTKKKMGKKRKEFCHHVKSSNENEKKNDKTGNETKKS